MVARMRSKSATCATVYFEFQLESGEKIFLFFSKAQLVRATGAGASRGRTRNGPVSAGKWGGIFFVLNPFSHRGFSPSCSLIKDRGTVEPPCHAKAHEASIAGKKSRCGRQ